MGEFGEGDTTSLHILKYFCSCAFTPSHRLLYPICILFLTDKLEITWKTKILEFTWLGLLPGVIGSSPVSYTSEYTPNQLTSSSYKKKEVLKKVMRLECVIICNYRYPNSEQSNQWPSTRGLGCSSTINICGDNRLDNFFLRLDTDVAVGSLVLCCLDQLSEPVVIVVDFLPLFSGWFVGLDLG